jgi:probable phosphoglycerate mutase
MSDDKLPRIYLARHADIPLTARGKQNARSLGARLQDIHFDRVLTSPLVRAKRTCELAGFGARAEIDKDLVEWNYGDYEGNRTAEIRKERPDWSLFRDGCPGGETPQSIGSRADRVIERLRAMGGDVLLFSHGHLLRVLGARWLGLPAADGQLLLLTTASLSILGYDHNQSEPVLRLWNDDRHVQM